MSYAQPIIPLIVEPVNLDKVIQAIQVKLGAKLPWLDYSFGRALSGERFVEGSQRALTYPEVYVGEGRYEEVGPNSHFGAHSFIQVAGPEKPIEYEKLQRNLYSVPLEIIFLFNLDAIKDKMAYTYEHRFTEELKQQIRVALESMPEVDVVIAMWETAGEVFRGYTYNHLQMQTFKHPYAGLKIAINSHYMENC
jgi:hypothetical protein